jgi:hypothetical protein
MNTKLVLFLSWFAAAALTASAVNAAPRGGGHGGHFSSISRGGQTFTRSAPTYSGRNWSGRNWSGRNWSGSNWRHHRFSRDRFIFIGGFGYPYYWGWDYPYGYGYSYYPYGGYSPYGYGYGNYDDSGYGYGYGGSGYGDRSRVVELQRRLARAGYYHGAIDGIMGSQTRRAIRAFERSRGELSMR